MSAVEVDSFFLVGKISTLRIWSLGKSGLESVLATAWNNRGKLFVDGIVWAWDYHSG